MKVIKKGLKQVDQLIFKGKVREVYNKKLRYRNQAYQLTDEFYFPPHETANKQITMGPYGELLAIGGDLSTKRIIHAFKCGVYPMFFADQPILWWTAEIRCVIKPGHIHIGKDVRRLINQNRLILTADQAFDQVVQSCADLRKDFTWLTPERISAFKRMHAEGYCHSIEVWQDEELVGGLFGTGIGSYFYIESSFTIVTHSSKYAMVALALRMDEKNCTVLDCGIWPTSHLLSMGAEVIERKDFLELLEKGLKQPEISSNCQILFKNWDFRAAVLNMEASLNSNNK